MGLTMMLTTIAPTPTATPRTAPASRPPSGRLKPKGASEKLAFRPRARATTTPSQKRQTTSAATAVFVRTTESSVPWGSLTAPAPQVDLVRGPAPGRVLQQPLLQRSGQELYPPQLPGVDPAQLAQRGLRVRRDLGVGAEAGLRVVLRGHTDGDVHGVP